MHYNFKSINKMALYGGIVYFVKNIKDCIDFQWLIGEEVLIKYKEPNLYSRISGKVTAVESNLKAYHNVDEIIGLLL